MDELRSEVRAWVEERNRSKVVVDWRFTTAGARIKDVCSVVSFCRALERTRRSKPAVEVDLAVVTPELAKVLGDSLSPGFQPRQARRCGLRS